MLYRLLKTKSKNKLKMSKYQYEISLIRYGGFYYNYIVWDRILQFLGIGKYYDHWKIGKIYVRSDLKFGPSTKTFLSITETTYNSWDSGADRLVRQNFIINKFYRLVKKTAKTITFCPILCVHEKDVKNGMELLQIHCNYRFADKSTSRNPIGKKIILKNSLPEGYGLYEERNYYYKRMINETDRQFKSRTKNNFFSKKKPKSGNTIKLFNKTTIGDILK